MFRQLNNNPNKKIIGDCVVRAIATALGKSWEEVYIGLCLQGLLMSDMPSANAVWGHYLNNKGWARDLVKNDTVNDFAAEFPKGIYIVGTGTHATVVIDGDIIDTWDCGAEQPIYYYFEQEELS